MPGGFGTLDELFEALTLVQTSKVDPVPIILYGSQFWAGLMDWIRGTLLAEYATISAGDPDLLHVVDSAEAVVEVIDNFYAKSLLRPNF
jgi:predicted Rossmann-fold nucleotide-binding protein